MLAKDVLVEEFIVSNPRSQKAFERAREILPGGNTRSVFNSFPFPLVLESGCGCEVTSLDGKVYTDFSSDFTAALYGHSNPVIYDSLREIFSTGFALGGVVEKEAELGEIIRKRFPSMKKIRFCNSGTEANMYALATALVFTGRKKILVFDRGYHGGTMSFPDKGNPLNLPHDFIIGKFDSIESTQPLLNADIAAIIVEPLQAAGGVRPASKEFLAFLRKAADELHAILIFDECVTSRLHFNGMQGALGVIPDMTVVGKYMGGGLPFGAFGGREDIMNLYDPYSQGIENTLFHSGTFNGNVFTLNAAIAASKLVTAEALLRLNNLGDRLRTSAHAIIEASGFEDMYFTGHGSEIGVHFRGDDAVTVRESFFYYLLRHGLMIGFRGFICLNLLHTDESVDQLLQCIQRFVDEYQS
ncbi:hypothetical protein TWF102_004791 [Orbilia oligospora]|uniref:Glutamate-1-semialdehyde 2,1-aminomutase n=1 Tax=Orbilia oligospora TaxID=2813651 RepID=A0A7C8JB07_ORBOL|nr:hypothetical protein TWF706_006580 [Orbilia oligospora]KAF3101539.1 hypothetical protein TWF102_004791 [Orbilia oligospora]KAF3105588.1 hypothetical protein TWF103_006644 [Orbilia oligospora]